MTHPPELSDSPANACPPDQVPDAVEVVARAIYDAEVELVSDYQITAPYPDKDFGRRRDSYRTIAQAAITALRAYDEGRGMVVVPREATEAMLAAYWCSIVRATPEQRMANELATSEQAHKHKARHRYRAMIAAAETGE